MYGVTWFKGEILYVVTMKDAQYILFEITNVLIIEENLVIEGLRFTRRGEMGHVFDTHISIHITRHWIMDFSLSRCILMEILSLVGALVHQKWGVKNYHGMGEDERSAPEL